MCWVLKGRGRCGVIFFLNFSCVMEVSFYTGVNGIDFKDLESVRRVVLSKT